jgi:hypothetical protein
MYIGSIQRFGQKDGCATIFLQRVAQKTSSLVCTQGAIVVVHDLKGQLAATEFTSFGFDPRFQKILAGPEPTTSYK